MSTYLARLKQIENGKKLLHTPDILPTKPTEHSFVSYGGSYQGNNEKNKTDGNNLLQVARKQKVATMLKKDPKVERAIYTDTHSDPKNVILTTAVRNVATCEMLIPKSKYDPWQLLVLTEQLEVKNVH